MTRPHMSKPNRLRHAALCAFALFGASPIALAQTPAAPASPSSCPAASTPEANRVQANEFRLKGSDADEVGHYFEAIGYYECALQLSPDPRVLHNVAYPYEKVGRYADALTMLLRFKAEGQPDQVQALNVDKRIALLRNKVAVLKVNVNVPGARMLVHNRVVGTKPAEGPFELRLNPGPTPIEVAADGYRPYYKEHTLQSGSALELEVQLNQRAQPTTVIRERPVVYVASTPFWSQWWFWAGASALVVGGAITVYALSTEKAPSGNPHEVAQSSASLLRF